MRLASCCVAALLLLAAGYFLLRGDYGAGSSDVGGSIQDMERDVGEAQSGIDIARRENQNARDELGWIREGIDRAADRAYRLQKQTEADRELLGEIRDGNERCQDFALELDRTIREIEIRNKKARAQTGDREEAAGRVGGDSRSESRQERAFRLMILSKIWQKTILNSRYLLPHAPKIFTERK